MELTLREQRRSAVVSDMALDLLAAGPTKLSAASSTLLWHLIKTLPPAGAHLSLTQIAETLGRVQVTNVMHRLLEIGCLVRGPKDGVLHLHKLNPVFFQTL